MSMMIQAFPSRQEAEDYIKKNNFQTRTTGKVEIKEKVLCGHTAFMVVIPNNLYKKIAAERKANGIYDKVLP